LEILAEYIKTQKMKNNMEVIGTDSTGTLSVNEYGIKRPVMVIIGNEAKGMSVKLKEICDKIVKIPIEGNVNSLNVSCAASIIMWEIYRHE
jgi:TrmH family RNA methyltransferase